ncbi:MAG: outer membrane beta-barrel protein, partial [Ignavibacteria bacterium]
GYSLPLADLKGDYPDSLGLITRDVRNTYLMKSGFSFGVSGKYAIDSTRKSRVTAGLNYNRFSQTKDYELSGGRTRTVENRMSITAASLGLEYSFRPAERINPFIGLELMGNFFGGKIETSGDTTIIQNRKFETRFGVQANGGADFRITKNIGVIIGVRYCLANLIGKDRRVDTASNYPTDDEQQGSGANNEIQLNDKESSTQSSKVIYYLQFYAGVSVYLGQPMKKVKKSKG